MAQEARENRLMATHHELSPSSAPALMQCACYESYSGTDIFSDANKGTALHEYTEALIVGKAPADSEVLDDGEKEKCETAAKNCIAFCRSYNMQCEIQIEQPVKIMDARGRVISEGTQDILSLPDVGGDLKSGFDFKPKNHDYKPQQAFYALGRMQTLGVDRMHWFEYYIMPEKMITYDLTYDECVAIVRCVCLRKYDRDKKPQACYFCRNCKNILYCPAVNARVRMVSELYSDLPLPDKLETPGAVVSGDEMSVMLAFAKDILKQYISRIDSIVKQIEAAALGLSDIGVPIPYYQRVGKSANVIEDFDRAFSLLPELPAEKFKSALKLSIPKLADIYYRMKKECGEKITQKNARNELEARLARVIVSGETTYSLERIMERK